METDDTLCGTGLGALRNILRCRGRSWRRRGRAALSGTRAADSAAPCRFLYLEVRIRGMDLQAQREHPPVRAARALFRFLGPWHAGQEIDDSEPAATHRRPRCISPSDGRDISRARIGTWNIRARVVRRSVPGSSAGVGMVLTVAAAPLRARGSLRMGEATGLPPSLRIRVAFLFRVVPARERPRAVVAVGGSRCRASIRPAMRAGGGSGVRISSPMSVAIQRLE